MLLFIFADRDTDPETSTALRRASDLRRPEDRIVAFGIGDDEMRPIMSGLSERGADETYLIGGEDLIGGGMVTRARIVRAFVDLFDDEYLLFFDDRIGEPMSLLPSVAAGLMDIQQFIYVTSISRDDGFICTSDYRSICITASVPPDSVVSFIDQEAVNGIVKEGAEPVALDRVALNLGRFSAGVLGSKIVRVD